MHLWPSVECGNMRVPRDCWQATLSKPVISRFSEKNLFKKIGIGSLRIYVYMPQYFPGAFSFLKEMIGTLWDLVCGFPKTDFLMPVSLIGEVNIYWRIYWLPHMPLFIFFQTLCLEIFLAGCRIKLWNLLHSQKGVQRNPTFKRLAMTSFSIVTLPCYLPLMIDYKLN